MNPLPRGRTTSPAGRWDQVAARSAFAAEHRVDPSAATTGPLWSLLREDFEHHYRSLVHPGLHALWVHRLGHWGLFQPVTVRRAVKVVHRLVNRLLIQNVYGAEIADDAFIGRRVVIAHQQGVQLPSYSVVGDDSVVRHNVTLGLAGTEVREDVPAVGRGVELGTGATLIGRIEVGDHAKIGPHALVMADVPAGATAFSPPARVFVSDQASRR